MTKTKYVVGNWKMHTTRESALKLVNETVEGLHKNPSAEDCRIIICPPYPHLYTVGEILRNAQLPNVFLGAQDCSARDAGTGDVPAQMLLSMGVKYVILGHSERRLRHHETDHLICSKAEWVAQAGLTPIVCIGETLEEREAGQIYAILKKQITTSLRRDFTGIVAYEPIWAVGSGAMATAVDIRDAFEMISELLSGYLAAELPPILYGGAVQNGAQAKEIFSLQMDGVLVGRACLEAAPFLDIIHGADS
ncbi:triose-phosphate isomerase [Acetobacteraceae bacterium]|nr:triose-phosphate isomerase [Acetobacteraceae bacterium]